MTLIFIFIAVILLLLWGFDSIVKMISECPNCMDGEIITDKQGYRVCNKCGVYL